MRSVARADRLCYSRFRGGSAIAWEASMEGVRPITQSLFESDGRILGFAASGMLSIASVEWAPEPLPVITSSLESGPYRALIGQGLWLSPDVDPQTATSIHRLARTLYADQVGARYAIVVVPVPTHPSFDPQGVVQQIAAGAIDHAPIALPISEGYWPIGIGPYGVLLAREQRAF